MQRRGRPQIVGFFGDEFKGGFGGQFYQRLAQAGNVHGQVIQMEGGGLPGPGERTSEVNSRPPGATPERRSAGRAITVVLAAT